MEQYPLNPYDTRSRAERNLEFLKMESLFFGAMVPSAVVLSAVFLVGQTVMLPTALWRGRDAFDPWQRMLAVWSLVFRHVRYFTRYVFLKHFRLEVQRTWGDTRRKAAEIRARIPTPTFDWRVLDEMDGEDVGAIIALLPHLVTFAILVPQIAVNVAMMVVLAFSWHYYGIASPPRAPIEAAPVVYQPQVADTQEADFGPWAKKGAVASKVAEPSFRNIALLSDDGSAKYSTRYAGSLDGFEVRLTERIVGPAVDPDGRVRFTDQHGNAFHMNVGQAFMIENDTHAYAFAADGTLLAIHLKDLNTVPLE